MVSTQYTLVESRILSGPVLSPPQNYLPQSLPGLGPWAVPERILEGRTALAPPAEEGQRTGSQETGLDPGLSKRASVFSSVKWARGPGRTHLTDRLQGGRLGGKGITAGYLRMGPAGVGQEPGSRRASLGLRACGSGGAGPWLALRVADRGSFSAFRVRRQRLGSRGGPAAPRLRAPDVWRSNCPLHRGFTAGVF